MPPPSQPPHFLTDPAYFQFWLRDVTLFNATAASVCLHGNIRCAALMLRVILERRDLEVKSVTVENTLPNLYAHAVRFDILAQDESGRLYDIEIQAGGSLDALAQRARVYSAMLDMHQWKKGEDYKEVREHWVIFIVNRDVFGPGLPLYRVERCVLGGGEGLGEVFRLFDDGAHILFVNGDKNKSEGDTALARLIHDLHCADPAKMHYKELREAFEPYKTTKGGIEMMREAYTKWEQQACAVFRAQGREEGRKEGREEGIAIGEAQGREEGIAIGEAQGIAIGMEQGKRLFVRALLKKDFTLRQIADHLELPLEEVRRLAGVEDPTTPRADDPV